MSSYSCCMLFEAVRRFCDAKGNDNYCGGKQQLYSHAHENEAKLLDRMKVNIFYSLVVPVGRQEVGGFYDACLPAGCLMYFFKQ